MKRERFFYSYKLLALFSNTYPIKFSEPSNTSSHPRTQGASKKGEKSLFSLYFNDIFSQLLANCPRKGVGTADAIGTLISDDALGSTDAVNLRQDSRCPMLSHTQPKKNPAEAGLF